MRKRFVVTLAVVVLVAIAGVVVVFAAGGKEAATAKVVRAGITPYGFAMMFPAIHETGIDKEIGIDFKLVDFPTSAGTFQTLARGDLDMVGADMSEHIATIQTAPDMRTFGTNNLFKGFILIGRKGKDKPYKDLETELGDPGKAKLAVLQGLKGKDLVAAPFFAGIISDSLQQVGLSLNDIKQVQFADDQKAAAAFIGGVGDYYLGSLPQEIKMLGMPDQFVNMGGNTEIMGPASLYYGGMMSTDKYIHDNYDTILRIMAAFYRGARYLQDAIQKGDVDNLWIQIMKDNLNKRTAGSYTNQDMFNQEKVYEEILTAQRAWDVALNPSSKLYWKITGDYQMKVEVGMKHLDKEVDLMKYIIWDTTYADLTKRKDLMDFINKPLTPLKIVTQ